ncbi:serine/threonine protein kinase [Lachnospiraceae bacterium NSJ-171]|nr:serine/threonine protein kinase [Lachnospiraceae bacterium NSJ-171]
MYQWLSNVIKNEYKFVKALKNTEISKVLVYRNKNNNKKVIVRYIKDGVEIYEKLLTVKSEYLPQIFEVVRGKEDSIVMEEYIEGITVGDVLEGGLYTEEGVKIIIGQICDALNILHYHGIIHRDIKPDNIMITEEGVIKIIDFNASREYKRESIEDTHILGTTGFAPPEQYGVSQTDIRSDIYALGVMINVMLTGEHPSRKMCKGRYEKVIKKAVNINPNDRYQNCSELKKAL